jgi:hypothetical protein
MQPHEPPACIYKYFSMQSFPCGSMSRIYIYMQIYVYTYKFRFIHVYIYIMFLFVYLFTCIQSVWYMQWAAALCAA